MSVALKCSNVLALICLVRAFVLAPCVVMLMSTSGLALAPSWVRCCRVQLSWL